MIFLYFRKVQYFQMYLNTLLEYLYFVFTSIAGKYLYLTEVGKAQLEAQSATSATSATSAIA